MITDFARAKSIDDALTLFKAGYTFIAGGTQVNNAAFARRLPPIEKVVSIEDLGLAGIELEGEAMIIGATTTLQDIADSELVPEALKNGAGFIPTRSVRNIATIGGNIAANRPDSYIIPTLIALGATVDVAHAARAGTASTEAAKVRTLSVENYIAEQKDDLILRIRMPRRMESCVAVKESRSQLSLPVVSAAVAIGADGNRISKALVAAGCVAPRVIRITAVEDHLEGASLEDGEILGTDGIFGAEGPLERAISNAVEPVGDILGSAEYKRYINSVVIADAIRLCIEKELVARGEAAGVEAARHSRIGKGGAI